MQRAEEDPACRDAGAKLLTGTPWLDAIMPRGFATPGAAAPKASEAPPIWGVLHRSAREIEAPAGARGERTRAPRGGAAEERRSVRGVSDLRRVTPGSRDMVRRTT